MLMDEHFLNYFRIRKKMIKFIKKRYGEKNRQ